jgi:LAS superfamily LD-carboxypeptidase LdcB
MGEGLRVLKKQDFQRCDKNTKLQTKEGLIIYTTSNFRKISESKCGFKKKKSKQRFNNL